MDLSTPQRFKRSREKSSPNDVNKVAKFGASGGEKEKEKEKENKNENEDDNMS